MEHDYIFNPGPDSTEDVEHYRHGGFHPVEINDTFKSGRYVVLHKLGHGGFSTVWLARDIESIDQTCVALKILSVDASKDVNEIAVQRWLSKTCDSFDSSNIVNLLDYFAFSGPNGRHTSLVFELCGPSLDTFNAWRLKIRPDFIRSLAKQIAQIVKNCHDSDVAIGDLSTKNILLKIKSIDGWTDTEVYDHFGKPNPYEMIPMDEAAPFPTCGPKHLYSSIGPEKGMLSFIKPEVILADLNEITCTGEDANISPDGRAVCVNDTFAGPESLLNLERKHTKALDIWALACTFFQMRTTETLLQGGCLNPKPDMVDIQNLLGEPPKSFMKQVRAAEAELEEMIKRKEEEDGRPYRHPKPTQFFHTNDTPTEQSLRSRLVSAGGSPFFHRLTTKQKRRCILETTSELDREHDDRMNLAMDPYLPPPPAKLSDEELDDFEDLLRKMLQYRAEDRLSITEILQHPWLNKQYQDLDDMGVAWLSTCTGGWQYSDAEEWFEQVVTNGATWQGRSEESNWGHAGSGQHDECQEDSVSNNWGEDSWAQTNWAENNWEQGGWGVQEIDNDNITDGRGVRDDLVEQHQASKDDSISQDLDLNGARSPNLEHVFSWQQQACNANDKDQQVHKEGVMDPSTAECHNLEHIFL